LLRVRVTFLVFFVFGITIIGRILYVQIVEGEKNGGRNWPAIY